MADDTTGVSDEDQRLIEVTPAFDVDPKLKLLDQLTWQEIILGESLLTPGLQTSIRCHTKLHQVPIRNYDLFKGVTFTLGLFRQALTKLYKLPEDSFLLDQVVYRLDSRHRYNENTEEITFHCCDPSLLDDAANLVSNYWSCARPSDVVNQVLRQCAGVRKLQIETAEPARPYIAENIHPFQVVSQQCNAALANGMDPSFIHYMTYENLGTHHFKSLYNLTKQSPIITFIPNETGDSAGLGSGVANPYQMIAYKFPCDFDLLSDILNGVDAQGRDINSLFTINPLSKSFNIFGSKVYGCGIGQGVAKMTPSNQDTAKQQDSCPDYAYLYLQKRQARMALLEQDKIALRVTIPWNPMLHAGKIISIKMANKEDPELLNYGSGDYLIVSMTHNIKYYTPQFGYGTTTLDCVSKTVGQGVV